MNPAPPVRPRRAHAPRAALLAALLGLAVAGCRTNPQRITGPLGRAGQPAGGELSDTTEAVVLRHADPVYVRRAGAAGGYPLAFWRKRDRVRAGAWISTGGGGRVELLWPGSSSSVVLFDDGTLEVGDVAHDEPLVRLHQLTRARLVLTPDASVEVVGGALLRGDPLEVSGPFVLDQLDTETLRIVNQSKRDARILYRDEILDLRSGEAIDLVALPGGTSPRPVHPDRVALQTPVGEVLALGRVQSEDAGGRARLVAEESAEVEGLGVLVRLEAGDEVLFSPLGGGRQATPAEPPSQP